jgi:hypothetical protein
LVEAEGSQITLKYTHTVCSQNERASARDKQNPRAFDPSQRRAATLAPSKPERPEKFEDSLVSRARLRFDRGVLPWDQRAKDLQYSKPKPYFGAPIEGTVHGNVRSDPTD